MKEEAPKGKKAASSTSASLAGERSGRVELGLGVHRGTLDGEGMVCSIYLRVVCFPAAPLSDGVPLPSHWKVFIDHIDLASFWYFTSWSVAQFSSINSHVTINSDWNVHLSLK